MLDLGIAAFGTDLVAAWKGFGADQSLWYSSFDGSNWSAPAKIPNVGSSWGPSLAEFNGRLYAAWRGTGADQSLWYSSFDGSSWAPQAQVPVGLGSSIGPSLAVFNGRLYAAYKGADNDTNIGYTSFDGSTWAPAVQIPGVGSSWGPSLAGWNGRLYAAWRGTGTDQSLWYSSFDGSNWAPQTQVPVGLGSSIGPTLRVGFGDRLYVAYKGADNDTNIGYTSFDGSTWAPAARLTTNGGYAGASLDVFQNKLYAAWRGDQRFVTTGNDPSITAELWYSSFDGSSWAPQALIPGTLTDVPPTGKYVYSIQLTGIGLLAGDLNIDFFPFGSLLSGAPLATFFGGFGGLVAFVGGSWGTAWLNYDVVWLAQQGWNARFEANFVPPAANVNLWELSGEVIGNTASGGTSVLVGVVGGQGYFYLPGHGPGSG